MFERAVSSFSFPFYFAYILHYFQTVFSIQYTLLFVTEQAHSLVIYSDHQTNYT